MLTTTLDGLWVLQVLTEIEVLAPELGLRPHLPSVESARMALAHPVARELRGSGVIDDDGAVDQTVVEWLTVLSRRDVALLVDAKTPAAVGAPERILLARFAQWWVTLERCGAQVRLSGAGVASSEESAARLISTQIQRLCGEMPAAAMKPVTIEVDQLIRAVTDGGGLRAFLIEHRLDGDQIALLTLAADGESSAQASVVALQSGVADGSARCHVGSGVVTILDTPQGRLVSEHVTGGGRSWMVVSPGSAGTIASAVLALMRNLPAHEDWFSYRKVV